MIGALSHGKQRARAYPTNLGMVPARQCLGASQGVLRQSELRLEYNFDLTAIDSVQQIGFELGRSSPGACGFAVSPGHAPSLLAAHVGERLAEPVKHRFGTLLFHPAQQGNARREAQHCTGHRQGSRHHVCQLPGEQLPALATAGFIGNQHKGAATGARRQPWPFQFARGKMREPRRDFGQGCIPSGSAIGPG